MVARPFVRDLNSPGGGQGRRYHVFGLYAKIGGATNAGPKQCLTALLHHSYRDSVY